MASSLSSNLLPKLPLDTKWRFITNLASYNVLWFACIMAGSTGIQLMAVVMFAVLITVHLKWVSRNRQRDVLLMLCAALLGLLTDSALAATGFLQFNATWPLLPTWVNPIWMLLLWAGFSTTLYEMLGWSNNRVWLQVILGVTGGPPAYWGGMALGALDFEGSFWVISTLIAVQYGVGLPLLYWLGNRFDGGIPNFPIPALVKKTESAQP
ncbi:MAG: DUF2878 domain-containing protein [Candidatus Sumerlaeia bacterium]|nr:DUF2878 domain-containing protein [Candidatus Sumerlaeia bacterium]